MVRIDLDPTPRRAFIVALLLFFEALIGGLLVVYQDPHMVGDLPTIAQMVTILGTAAAALVSYLLGFMKRD